MTTAQARVTNNTSSTRATRNTYSGNTTSNILTSRAADFALCTSTCSRAATAFPARASTRARATRVFFSLFLAGAVLFPVSANAVLTGPKPRIGVEQKSSSGLFDFLSGKCENAELGEADKQVIRKVEREYKKNPDLELENVVAFELDGKTYVLFDNASAVYVLRKNAEGQTVVDAIDLGGIALLKPSVCGEAGRVFFKGRNTGTTFYILEVSTSPSTLGEFRLEGGGIKFVK